MLSALLDAYQKTLSSNLNEEISNIALEIKLTRIRDANEAFTLDTLSLELHVIRHVSKNQMRCILYLDSNSACS